jgi:hypothetical protein
MPSPAQDASPEPAQPPQPQRSSRPPLSKSPIHLLAAIVTVAVNKVWDSQLIELANPLPLGDKERFFLWASVLLLVATTVSTTLTQYLVDKDRLGVALAKGLAMGVLASLPYSFSSTEVGLIFIGWSGINELQRQQQKFKQEQEQDPQPTITQ